MYNITPPPNSLMTSFRSIGYDLKTSIADLMDNSISADAKNIHVLYPLIEKSTPNWIAILDDGKGMNKTELGFALTPGKKRSERNAYILVFPYPSRSNPKSSSHFSNQLNNAE